MTFNAGDCGCSALPAMQRCAAELPDNPQCAPNYHFGMLLGVDDFRAEQGFHIGRLRRHQRLLHGAGVVAGYGVAFNAEDLELRVDPGYAIDRLGRDLLLTVKQCVSLPKWWLAHRGEDAFHDIVTPDDATFDLDVVVCYASCLDSPVPAIAEPCAGDAADVAYSRACETVRLTLVRSPETSSSPQARPFHLLAMWLGLAGARIDSEGKPLDSDKWLLEQLDALEALPLTDQIAARSSLLGEVLARAVAETSPDPPQHQEDESDLCLPLARLHDVHLRLDPGGWTATIGSIDMGIREVLLPTSLLQSLTLADPQPVPASAGPVVVDGGATISGTDLDLVFNQKLAAATATLSVFQASEYVDALGWKPFTLATPVYDESDPAKPKVRLALDRAPVGKLIRVTVIGNGNTPLLGANLIPAGAVRPDGDGRTLTTSIRG